MCSYLELFMRENSGRGRSDVSLKFENVFLIENLQVTRDSFLEMEITG